MSFDHAAEFELAVCPQDRIRIDGQIDRQLPHGGKLIASGQRSRRKTGPDLVDDLAVDGNSAAQIQGKLETLSVGGSAPHVCQCTIYIVH